MSVFKSVNCHQSDKGKISIKPAPLISMATGFPLLLAYQSSLCLVMYSSTLSDLYFV